MSQQLTKRLYPAARVTGIGGIFFKCQDPVALREWYARHLGLQVNEYGSLMESRDTHLPGQINYLQWSTFSAASKYMDPSKKDFMINYRVTGLEALLEQLRSANVVILDEIERYDYGNFVHILDPEGNKIELWEPIDSVFTQISDGQTTC